MRNSIIVVLLSGLIFLALSSPTIAQGIEYDTDRVGGDFDRVTLHVSNPKACQGICRETDQCVAWTYTPIGFNGYGTPQCWLKDKQVRGFERKGTVSGTFPARFAAADTEEAVPVLIQTAEAARAECIAKINTGAYESTLHICLQEKAADQVDASICDGHPDSGPRKVCRDLAGGDAMLNCRLNKGPEASRICQMAVAVEFPDPTASCGLASDESIWMCYVTVAAETGQYRHLLEKLDNEATSKDRDTWIAGLAMMTHDTDLLELIEDNRTYDKAVTAVAVARIGAGKYVEPGVCSALTGGYTQTDVDGDLGAADYQTQCVQTVAMARVVSKWAEDKSVEDVLALQEAVGEWAIAGDDDELDWDDDLDREEDYSDFPMGLGDAIRAEITAARSELQAVSITQSGLTDSNTRQPVTPNTTDIEIEPLTSGDNCVFGVCPE